MLVTRFPFLPVSVLSFLFLSFLFVPDLVLAWGKSGHSLTGRVAFHLLSNSTIQHLKRILPNVAGDISLISSWADRVKRLPRYSNTGPWHYSDAHDNPPYSCSYSYLRDCPNGQCVIAAIRNMTQILIDYQHTTPDTTTTSSNTQLLFTDQSNNSPIDMVVNLWDTITSYYRYSVIAHRRQQLSNPTTPPIQYSAAEALKFLVHMVQDVHQPLHLSGRDKGGNEVKIKFNGHQTNLHVVWDSLMLDKALADDYRGSEIYLTEVLLTKMRADWETEVDTWTTCPPTIPTSNSVVPPGFQTPVHMIMCPEYWAKGIDMLNCNNVWKETFSPNDDLAHDYYRDNLPVVLKAIAMGGVRLAALLEAIFNPDRVV